MLPGHAAAWLCPKCLLQQAATPAPQDSSPAFGPQASTLNQPTVLHYFGDYELIEEIARGGMGVVYKARQVSLNRTVAVKMLLFGKLAGDDFIKRFRAEAEAAASLQHPNIVAIHEVGDHDGQQYFSMDYVDGANLSALAAEKPLPPRRAAEYLKRAAEAIHFAHERGILHRDLKPSNVLIDKNDQPRITDFGLAKKLQGDSDLTITGQVLGTPNYMSPEQAGGKRGEVSIASDVYALGAILYYLLTGRAPFVADTMEGVLTQLLQNDPVPPRVLNPGIPRDLETICLKCLNKEPAGRYASARALSEDLARWLNDDPIQARAVGPGEKFWHWCRRKPALAAAIAALLVVTGTGLAGILWQWRRAEQHAIRETAQRIRAEEAMTSLELQRAEDLLEKDEITMGMAYLTRIVRQQPTNRVAAQRLLAALTQRNFAMPIGEPLVHNGMVLEAQFSPDGRYLATASADCTARVWDAHTGEPMTPPMLHESGVRSVQFSPDGRRLVTFTQALRVRLWEAATGHALGGEMQHAQKIRSASFSPDGSRVVTASDDGTAQVWDGHTGEPLLVPLKHAARILWVCFRPDGKQIATASADKTLQLWDALTGQPSREPLAHSGEVKYAEFSTDGRWILTVAGDNSTCVWNAMTGQRLATTFTHSDTIDAARFSPDGERVVTGSRGGVIQIWRTRDWAPLAGPIQAHGSINSVEFGREAQRILAASHDYTARLWDAETGEALSAPMQHDGLVWSARLSSNGIVAVTASADGTARLWDVRPGGAQSRAMRHKGAVIAADLSPDGEWVVTASDDKTARIWNVLTGRSLEPALEHSSRIVAVQFSPDGSRVATASVDGTARIWDSRTAQPLTDPLHHGTHVSHLEFNSDGQWLATGSYGTNFIRLWNARTGELHTNIIHQDTVPFLRFSPDGQRLMSGEGQNDTAQIRDITRGGRLVEMRGHAGWIMFAEFSRSGERVVTASEDGSARVWNANTGQALSKPLQHKGRLRSARFNHKGDRVVTASEDGTAQVWDVQSSEPVGEPLRHKKAVTTAEFSPDGAMVVTASNDGTARLWDAQTGRPVSESFQHEGVLISARFSPDGHRVFTASFDGTARVWDVPPRISSRHAPEVQPYVGVIVDLAEAITGKRVNGKGVLESAPRVQPGDLRERVTRLPRNDLALWLEWFLADRTMRTISPYSQVTFADYICTLKTSETSFRSVLAMSPTDGIAFANMAQHCLKRSRSIVSFLGGQAAWASGQAVKFAPWDSKAWHYRSMILERLGNWTQLLAEAEEAIESLPTNACVWNAKARALQGLEHFDAMLDACNRALESWHADKTIQWDLPLRRDILRKRSFVRRRLGNLTEAVADNLAALELAPRAPGADPKLIDLSAFYNGGSPEEFPGAISHLAGTDFDFRGWIHLDLQRIRPEVASLPERVEGIPLERQCRRLHFLHTASSASRLSLNETGQREEVLNVPLGVAIGHYVIRYANGEKAEIPIVHGRDVRDYWMFPEYPDGAPYVVPAWTGSTHWSRREGATTRVYKSTWENPRPDVAIRSIDFVHGKTQATPILIAITAE